MKLFLTGVTGFLGGELLVELSKRPEIEKIFCLVRTQNEEEAITRLKKVFDLHGDYFDSKKIIPVTGELSDTMLSEKLIHHTQLNDVDTIIHSAANTSFSKIFDEIVQKVNIGGTLQILRWAKSLNKLNLFTYVGTATICGTTVNNCLVSEDISPDLNSKHLVKYSYTKMIGELILENYLPSEKILVVRPSIIMGDTRPWVPRSYVILWALATLNELRLFPANPDSKIDIIPIDYAAHSIIELVFSYKRKYNVYHISSGSDSSTTPEKATNAIKDLFPYKPDFKFVARELLDDMKKWTRNGISVSEENNLYQFKNYLNYWVNNFGSNSKLRILFYAIEPYINFIELGQIFDNSRLLEDTEVGHSVPAHIYLSNMGKYFESIDIFEGAIDP